MTQATHWFADKLIDYNQSQDTGMMIIKIPSWKYFELKSQAQELENQLNKSSFGKGQEWEHKNMIANDDTKVSETFLENTPTSSQTEDNSPKVQNKDSFGEISDEEIEEEIHKRYMNPIQDYAWRDACKWYREQLKQRQNG